MSDILASYSPEDVTVAIAGVTSISGFADGTFIRITKDIPTYKSHVSADGQVSRQFQAGGLYTVNLILSSTSASNQVLSYLARADELTQMGKFPIIIKDQLGSSLFFSTTSWIETMPDTSFSTKIEEREWTIKCTQAMLNVGGNERGSTVAEDFMNSALGFAGGML